MKQLSRINKNHYFENVLMQCKKIAKEKDYKVKVISLHGDRMMINRVKKAGLICKNPTGEWNGYGYEQLPLAVIIFSVGQMRVFNKIKKEVNAKRAKVASKPKPDPKIQWAKRLSKLTGLNLEECLQIADEKLAYKNSQIDKLFKRQEERYSVKRDKLIAKIANSNPLRYIKDEDHAQAIINASSRHHSDYQEKLDLVHEYEERGIIEKGHAQELARSMDIDELDNHLEELTRSW